MCIVIEGPDGCGKTTLGQMLMKDGVVERTFPSPKVAFPDKMLFVSSANYLRTLADLKDIAIDRFFFSELVYGPVLRDRIEFSEAEVFELWETMIKKNVFIIFCLPGIVSIKTKPEERLDVLENMHQIYERYMAFYEIITHISKGKRCFRYEWDKPDSYKRLLLKLRR